MTTTTTTPLQEKINSLITNIKEQIKTKGYYTISTCDFRNWDVLEHHAVQHLYINGIEGIYINYKINFGVHDWYFSNYATEFQTS